VLEEQFARLVPNYGRVVIKLGPAGAVIGTAAGLRLSLPAPKVEVVDTTGAGDAFAAGFLSAELRGEALETALAAGIKAGAVAVTQIGGQPA